MPNVHVLYNTDRRAMLAGYHHQDNLRRVSTTTCFAGWTDQQVLDSAFRRMQQPANPTLRSMSVGDVVIIERTHSTAAFACEPMGWTQIAVPSRTVILEVI
ncbi:MAG: hypothetical protein FJ038_11680 [Chloroflexi bacterium]|nr:hypothetical protein [Chloroflexota bacterium]